MHFQTFIFVSLEDMKPIKNIKQIYFFSLHSIKMSSPKKIKNSRQKKKKKNERAKKSKRNAKEKEKKSN